MSGLFPFSMLWWVRMEEVERHQGLYVYIHGRKILRTSVAPGSLASRSLQLTWLHVASSTELNGWAPDRGLCMEVLCTRSTKHLQSRDTPFPHPPPFFSMDSEYAGRSPILTVRIKATPSSDCWARGIRVKHSCHMSLRLLHLFEKYSGVLFNPLTFEFSCPFGLI